MDTSGWVLHSKERHVSDHRDIIQGTQHGPNISFFLDIHKKNILFDKQDGGKPALSILQCHITNSRWSTIFIFHCKVTYYSLRLEPTDLMTLSYSTELTIRN